MLPQERGGGAQAAATALAQFAHTRAADPTHLSPFAYGAQQLGYRYFGGKMDDITVLVGYVVPAGPQTIAAAAAAGRVQPVAVLEPTPTPPSAAAAAAPAAAGGAAPPEAQAKL